MKNKRNYISPFPVDNYSDSENLFLFVCSLNEDQSNNDKKSNKNKK